MKKGRLSYIAAGIASIAVLAAAVFILGRSGAPAETPGAAAADSAIVAASSSSSQSDSQSNSRSPVSDPASSVFTFSSSGASFRYPAGVSPETYPESGGDMVLLSNAKANLALQIFASPYGDPDGSVTAEKIKEGIPGIVMDNIRPVSVAGLGQGVSFDSAASGAPVRDVWFSHGGFLYQITAAKGSESLLEEIVNGWKF